MKDWKAEFDKQKGIILQLEKDLKYYQDRDYNDAYERKEYRNAFKKLILDVLER